ncbi:MAG TPA: thiamine-phosphate kinase [Dehalococcoidales bacterium]|nr:thiamine-phosphate kinase [Dehalococcoidales bacterium]
MKITELGEFGLIDVLSGMVDEAKPEDKETAERRPLVLGIGDDAAAWRVDDSVQLATVDTLVQGIHFNLETTGWEDLGWKALAVNLSDIAAMGGVPRYALVSLSLPGQTEVEDVKALYRGMLALAKQSGVTIVGGNMSGAPAAVVSITVLGDTESKEKQMLTRSAARAGQKIAVTGYLGAAAAGLEMLAKGLSFDKEAAESLKKAHLTPTPRIAEGRLMVQNGVRAAIDISDGLLADLRHICESSKVGARLEIESIPVHPAAKANFGEKALELALAGGEDYELLFTASAVVIEKVKAALACPVTIIGEITAVKAGEVILLDGQGNRLDPAARGWDHFAKNHS